MKVLVVSDNHRDESVLEDLINIHTDVDLWLHCGDSELGSNHPIWETFKTVQGNMDWDSNHPKIIVESLGDTTFLVLHGHQHQVKRTLSEMEREAINNDADIVFYGHSHVPKIDEMNGLYFMNPGSITQPRGDLRVGSYLIYEKNSDGTAVNFYDWNHNHLPELSQKFI